MTLADFRKIIVSLVMVVTFLFAASFLKGFVTTEIYRWSIGPLMLVLMIFSPLYLWFVWGESEGEAPVH